MHAVVNSAQIATIGKIEEFGCRIGAGRPGAGRLRGRAALVSSLHTTADSGTPYLPLALEATGARLVDTLFLGFWSFTEASPAAREHIDAVVKQLGVIAVSFNSFIQRMDNIGFLGTFARGLLATHTVCAWQPFRATHQRHQRTGGMSGWVGAARIDWTVSSASSSHPII